MILGPKGVAADKLEFAETKGGHPLVGDLEELGIQVHSVVMDAGLHRGRHRDPFHRNFHDISWNAAGDGQNANGRRSGNLACNLPELVLAAFTTTMKGLRRRHGEEERINPASERAATGGLIP